MRKTLILLASSSAAAASGFMSVRMSNLKLKKVPASSLHVSKPTWWLESRFHFSFADYYDPARDHFGALRVMNDDLVKPRAGFGAHPHRDAEIFSYIVDGFLSHADSMGSKEQLGRGSVQYMSAGRGVYHSEMNDHPSDTCRFIQVWITPDKRGHEPQYGSSEYEPEDRRNKVLQVLGGTGPLLNSKIKNYNAKGNPIRLHQDVNVFVSENDAGVEQEIPLGKNRQAYLLQIEGSSRVSEIELGTRDALQAIAMDESSITIKAGEQGSHWMLIEMERRD